MDLDGDYYWDAVLGNDVFPGTQARPFQTEAVLNNATLIAAGTRMHFRRGVGQNYGEVNAPAYSGSDGLPIVMRTWGSGAKPTFTANTDACIDLGANSWWTLTNLQPVNGLHPGGNDTVGGGVFIGSGASNIVIDGIDIVASFGAGILVVDVDELTIQNCNISGITNGGDVTRGDGICIRGSDAINPSTNVTIQSNTLGTCDRQQTVLIGCITATIKQNTHRGSASGSAIHMEPNANNTVSGVVIEKNDIKMTVGDGIAMGGTQLGATIDDITIRYNWIEDITGAQANGRGIDAASATNVVSHGNVIYDWYQSAVYNGGSYTHYNDTIVGYRHRGIQQTNSADGTIRNCCFAAGSDAISDTSIYSLNSKLDSDYNLFWSFKDDDGGLWYYDGWKTSLAAWRLASGGDDASLTADPLLSDVASGEYWPAADSPLVDAGETLAGAYELGLDPDSVWPSSIVLANHNDEGTGWEIGAYLLEFESSSSSSSPSSTSSSSCTSPAVDVCPAGKSLSIVGPAGSTLAIPV